jgi:hypothetical protein
MFCCAVDLMGWRKEGEAAQCCRLTSFSRLSGCDLTGNSHFSGDNLKSVSASDRVGEGMFSRVRTGRTVLPPMRIWADKTCSPPVTAIWSRAMYLTTPFLLKQKLAYTVGKDDGRVVYKIEIIDKDKSTKKVYIDTTTGKVHTVKD